MNSGGIDHLAGMLLQKFLCQPAHLCHKFVVLGPTIFELQQNSKILKRLTLKIEVKDVCELTEFSIMSNWHANARQKLRFYVQLFQMRPS